MQFAPAKFNVCESHHEYSISASMNKKKPLGITLVLLGACSIHATEPSPQILLPSDLALPSIAAEVPAEAAAFGGAWGGDAWQGLLPHVLVVERVNSDGTAGVVYALGDSSNGKIKGSWSRHTGTISGGRLHCVFSNGAVVDYVMNGDGTLLGQYVMEGRPSYVRLSRIAGIDAKAIITAAAKPPVPVWTEIRIPERSVVGETAGKTVTLQAMLYRTSLLGRRPLIVFNHGSTGGGIVPATTMPQYLNGAVPRVFLSLGYNVVAPLRKGFGGSDGPMMEEAPAHNSQEVQFDSAVEDLDAVIDYMRSQPFVDPAHIVVVGQSRGGMLSVAYAGRHPDKVAGVINFSGGWWGEHVPTGDFNVMQFSEAGHTTKVPMLWLYADHDAYYSLPYIEHAFEEFRARGGNGELVEVRDLVGNGHFLSAWPEKWQGATAAFLKKIQ